MYLIHLNKWMEMLNKCLKEQQHTLKKKKKRKQEQMERAACVSCFASVFLLR